MQQKKYFEVPNLIVDSLKSEIPNSKDLHNDLKNEQEVHISKASKDDVIKNANNKVLIDYLSPEIRENEKAKRLHKFVLLGLLASFLVIQFISVYSMSAKIVEYAITNDSRYEIVKALLAFISAYITSVVVELIAILNYIVKNVFDSSIADLVKIFKDNEEQEKEHGE